MTFGLYDRTDGGIVINHYEAVEVKFTASRDLLHTQLYDVRNDKRYYVSNMGFDIGFNEKAYWLRPDGIDGSDDKVVIRDYEEVKEYFRGLKLLDKK